MASQNPMQWDYGPAEAKEICDEKMVAAEANDLTGSAAGTGQPVPPVGAVCIRAEDKLDTIIAMLHDLAARLRTLETAVQNLTGRTYWVAWL